MSGHRFLSARQKRTYPRTKPAGEAGRAWQASGLRTRPGGKWKLPETSRAGITRIGCEGGFSAPPRYGVPTRSRSTPVSSSAIRPYKANTQQTAGLAHEDRPGPLTGVFHMKTATHSALNRGWFLQDGEAAQAHTATLFLLEKQSSWAMAVNTPRASHPPTYTPSGLPNNYGG